MTEAPRPTDAPADQTAEDQITARAFGALRRPIALTAAGLWAERLIRAFWPFGTVLLTALAALMFDALSLPVARTWIWGGAGLAGVLLLASFALGLHRLRLPTRGEALDRLDRSLPGRPITAMADSQAIGAADPASRAVWRAHVERMAERVRGVRPVAPDLDVSARDPWALRLMALTLFLMAIVFGSVWRIGGIAGIAHPGEQATLAGGPAWEGWLEPPAYTGRPSLYLADVPEGPLTLPAGTHVTLRLYGELGALTVRQSVSGSPKTPQVSEDAAQEFDVTRGGTLAVEGPGGKSWQIALLPDAPPTIHPVGKMEWKADGELNQGYAAQDDYGVATAEVKIQLDLAAVDRRFGLAIDPEPRKPFSLPLPLPVTGDRRDFREVLNDNLSQNPWARLPVILTFTATDQHGQVGTSEPLHVILPGRRFFDPLAKAVIEMRRDILWSRENGRRAAQILRAVIYKPDGFVRDAGAYLQLRAVIHSMEASLDAGAFDGAARDEAAKALWDIALKIEYGDLNNARERLERAQQRLSEAIRNGANEDEIQSLVQELQQAMQDYIRQLAQEQQNKNQDQNAQNQQQSQQITGQQLQDMLNRLQQLMKEGRMAEAQQLLEQLRQMMENLRITQGGKGMQSPGQQAMQGLSDTLRKQQGLSDDSFGQLQDQFNQQGQQQGQQGQHGEGQQQGQGGQQGQGQQQQGQQPGQGGQPGASDGGQGDGNQNLPGMLAQRQRALRQELNRQSQNLPGAGTQEGEAARRSLDRAGRAMDQAENALRQNDLPRALDNQAEALDALREGMQNLGKMLAQQNGQQGQQNGTADARGQRDPLGRQQGVGGDVGTNQDMLQGEDVYRRARELLDEIRRRSGDQSRSKEERDYLKRLLERF